jgi:hypothetical protein
MAFHSKPVLNKNDDFLMFRKDGMIAAHDDRADERHRMSRRTVRRVLHITSYPGWLYIHLRLPRWSLRKKKLRAAGINVFICIWRRLLPFT